MLRAQPQPLFPPTSQHQKWPQLWPPHGVPPSWSQAAPAQHRATAPNSVERATQALVQRLKTLLKADRENADETKLPDGTSLGDQTAITED